MTTPSFGYSTTRPEDEILPVSLASWSGVAIVDTSADADATLFPLDKAVRFTSTDAAYLAGAGTGAIAVHLAGLNDQLDGYGADVVCVRVAEGTGADAAAKLAATMANIIGDSGAQTGMWAMRNAGSTVHMRPRIWIVGHTAEQPDGLTTDNPVRVALAPHLEAAKAIAPVEVDITSKDKAIAARQLMSSYRMLPVGVGAKVYETVSGVSTLVERSMVARVAGLFVKVDTEIGGGLPFEPIANRAILGIADINRPIEFDLGDGSTEAQLMLANDISVVVKGEVNNPGAIADGGFVFIGVESAGNSDLWSQIHQVRTADYIDAEMAVLTRLYLGGRITPRRAEAWLIALRFLLLNHVNNEDILGFELNFPTVINSINDVRLGQLSIQTNVEPAPVFRRAKNEVRRYRPAVEALVNAIAAVAGSASAVVG